MLLECQLHNKLGEHYGIVQLPFYVPDSSSVLGAGHAPLQFSRDLCGHRGKGALNVAYL